MTKAMISFLFCLFIPGKAVSSYIYRDNKWIEIGRANPQYPEVKIVFCGINVSKILFLEYWGWSGCAMVLGKLPVPGRPTIWITVGQGPTALTVGAGGGCLDIFSLVCHFSLLSPSLWETARYRLKYCLKGPLNPKQPTNQFSSIKA